MGFRLVKGLQLGIIEHAWGNGVGLCWRATQQGITRSGPLLYRSAGGLRREDHVIFSATSIRVRTSSRSSRTVMSGIQTVGNSLPASTWARNSSSNCWASFSSV